MSDPVQMSLFQNPLNPSQAQGLGFAIQNPIQGMLMGQTAGVNLANNRLIAEQNKLPQMMQAQAMTLAAQAAQEKQETQRRAIELARKIAGPDYAEKAADMAELSQLTDPKQFQAAQEGFKNLSLEQQHSILRDGGTVISILRAGNTKAAYDYLDQRLEAARQSGDQRAMQMYSSAKTLIANSKDPKVAATMLEYQLSPFDGAKDMLESIHSTEAAPGERELKAAQAGNLRSEAAARDATTPSEIAQNYASAEQALADADFKRRQPFDKTGTDSKSTSTIAETQQAVDQMTGLINGFNKLVVNSPPMFGRTVPGTGAAGWLGNFADDLLGAGNPQAQWRAGVKSALSSVILKKLETLRPASDKDIEWLQKSVGDVDANPVMALNAIYRTRDLLAYANEVEKAKAEGRPKPEYPRNAYAIGGSVSGGPYEKNGLDFTFNGKPISMDSGKSSIVTNDSFVQKETKKLTAEQQRRLDELNSRITPSSGGLSARNR